jgi:hypothetical protein
MSSYIKAILHHGEAAFKRIRQFEELGGEDPILAHRLLKNTIPAEEYVLMTEKFYQLSGGVPGQTMEARTEECEGIGKVRVMVFYPKAEEMPLPQPVSLWERLKEKAHFAWKFELGYSLPRLLRLKGKKNFYHLPD